LNAPCCFASVDLAQAAKPWLKFSPTNPFVQNPLVQATQYFSSKPLVHGRALDASAHLEQQADSSDDEASPSGLMSMFKSQQIAGHAIDANLADLSGGYLPDEVASEPLHVFPAPSLPKLAEPAVPVPKTLQLSFAHLVPVEKPSSMPSSPPDSSITSRHNSASSSLVRAGESLVARRSDTALLGDASKQEPDFNRRSSSGVANTASKRTADRSLRPIDEVWRPYVSFPWFFGKMSREAAERLLLEKGAEGEFLIRLESNDSHVALLSFNDGLGVQHFPLTFTALRHKYCLEMDDIVDFSTLTALVEFYQRNNIALTHFRLLRAIGPAAITRSVHHPINTADAETRSRLNTLLDLRPAKTHTPPPTIMESTSVSAAPTVIEASTGEAPPVEHRGIAGSDESFGQTAPAVVPGADVPSAVEPETALLPPSVPRRSASLPFVSDLVADDVPEPEPVRGLARRTSNPFEF
jgi:hypothetical protein